ncbi:MAG: alpha/beta fold hydrolase [Xanthomonadales bacterium]|nr:alpha/beta fold hydrolase [Xanthomonadales bacterium]
MLPEPWARAMLAAGRRAGGLASKMKEVDRRRWHYLEGGPDDRPVLVCLHGFGADADHWVMVSRPLERHFHVLAPDLPGFGDTDPPEEAATATAQAEALREFLDAVGVQRCVLAGNSMGGWVATAFAERHPERVQGLWLLAPLGVTESEKSPVLSAVDAGEISPLDFTSAKDFQQRVMQPMFYRDRRLPRPLVHYFARRAVPRRELYKEILNEVREQSPSMERLADHVRVPVLLQWGDADLVTHPSGAESLRRHFSDLEVDPVERCGHLPMLERPERVVKRFNQFARDHGWFEELASNPERSPL